MGALVAVIVGLQAYPLSASHRTWLDEEVHFLIASAERERFLTLRTDEDRTRFIEGFWMGRDRSAHAERLQASERLFGPRGRLSSRGRVYQLLGPPTFRQDFASAGNRLVPIELWHYTGVRISFLPDSFYLVFFRAGGRADYRLWSPAADGIAALIVSAEPGRFLLDASAHELKLIDAELASAVQELVPGGGSLRSQSLLANLDAFADLAERERRFSDRVRTDVSVDPLPAHLVATVLRDDAAVPELHYAVELASEWNRRLPWRRVAGRWRSRFTLTARVLRTTDQSAELERWQDTLELDVSDLERRNLADLPLSFQGRRYLPTGANRFEVLLVSEDGAASVLGSAIDGSELAKPFLARGRDDVRELGRRLPFLVRNVLVSPLPSSSVVEDASVWAVTQLATSEATKLKWEVWRDGELESTEEQAVNAEGTMVLKAIALDGTPARYRVLATDGRKRRELRFRSGPGRGPPSIRVLAREPTPAEQSRYRFARVREFARRGKLDRAIEEMETVVGQQADNVRAHLELARLNYSSRRYNEVLNRLGAVAATFGNEVDLFVLMAASAEALGSFEIAVMHYERAVALAPENVELRQALEQARSRLP